MSRTVPPESRRKGPLRVFESSTEAIYQQWVLERTWPATRVILWISVAIWVTSPLVLPRVLDETFPGKVMLVCWGFGLPLVLATAAAG